MSRDTLLVSFAAATALLVVCAIALVVMLMVHTAAKRAMEREVQAARQASVWVLRRYEALEAECRHLAERRLPALIDAVARSHPGVEVPGLLHPEFTGTPVEQFFEQVQRLFRDAVDVVREDVGAAARAGVRSVAEEAQTHLSRAQMKVFEEFDKHPTDSPYHQGLMDFDHLVTLAVHELQRLRILAGSWAGAQRADCTLREVIESAKGRIRAFERVDYTYLPDTGEVLVEGRVVEPITVALAELLSNATSWSPGRVPVAVLRVQTGFCIQVEDHGAGLNPFQRQSAQRVLSQDAVLDVTRLRHDRKLGFAVVGRLASEYGFAVDVNSPSAGGGVRAVLRVPSALLADMPAAPAEAAPPPLPAERPAEPAVPRLPAPELPAASEVVTAVSPVWPGIGPDPTDRPVDSAVDAVVENGTARAAAGKSDSRHAPAAGSSVAGGLPKRQRRTPQPRRETTARMTVIDTSDPDNVADRMSGLSHLIQTSFADPANTADIDKESSADD